MAIIDRTGKPTEEEATTTTVPTGTTGEVDFLSLLTKTSGLKASTDKSVKAFIENLNEIKGTLKEDIDIVFFDKNVFRDLEYSHVIIGKATDGIYAYSNIELAYTDVGGISPRELILKRQNKEKIVVPGIAIENNFRNLVYTQLLDVGVIDSDQKVIVLDGFFIGANEDLSEQTVATKAFVQIYNYIMVSAAKFSGQFNESTITDAIKQYDIAKVSTMISTQTNPDFLGQPRYTTFEESLTADNTRKDTDMNKNTSSIPIGSTSGSVQLSIAVKEIVQRDVYGNPIGQPQNQPFVFPLVAINAITPSVPSLGSSLLLIASSSAMAIPGDYRWLESIITNVKPGKDPGSLIPILSPESKRVDLTSNKISYQEKETKIKEIVADQPMYCLDIPAFGFGSELLAPFLAGAKATPDTQALQDIVDSANAITKGAFGDYPLDKIFYGKSYTIVDGYFVDKNGENRSTDEVDLMYMSAFSKKTIDVAPYLGQQGQNLMPIINAFVQVELGMLPDNVKLAIFEAIGLNVTITGFKERIILAPEFIAHLNKSLAQAGVKFAIEPSRYAKKVTVGFGSAGYFDGAFMQSNVAGNFYTPYNAQTTYAGSVFDAAGNIVRQW